MLRAQLLSDQEQLLQDWKHDPEALAPRRGKSQGAAWCLSAPGSGCRGISIDEIMTGERLHVCLSADPSRNQTVSCVRLGAELWRGGRVGANEAILAQSLAARGRLWASERRGRGSHCAGSALIDPPGWL